MIVELFSDRPFIEKLFCRFKILISHFLITLPFPGNFPEISRKFLRNFSENSYIPHLPTLPTHHPIHTHQSEPTQNFKINFLQNAFFSNLLSFSHTVLSFNPIVTDVDNRSFRYGGFVMRSR